jgi:hypothetical protein
MRTILAAGFSLPEDWTMTVGELREALRYLSPDVEVRVHLSPDANRDYFPRVTDVLQRRGGPDARDFVQICGLPDTRNPDWRDVFSPEAVQEWEADLALEHEDVAADRG